MASDTDVHRKLSLRVLPDHMLCQFNYPRPDPARSGCIRPMAYTYGFKKGHCTRCDKKFDAMFDTRETCRYHLKNSRIYNRRQQPHECCGRSFGSPGCGSAPSHVYKGNLYLDLSGYRQTGPAKPTAAGGDYGIYAIDTESVHTKIGLEVVKVTVMDRHCHVVYETFCLPTSEIIDYSSHWSGINASDLDGVTKTFSDVRDDLLALISEKTILVGHGVDGDLIALRLIHSQVVDTADLYPHRRGLPYRLSLKQLASLHLGRTIQRGGASGHDSHEDAEVAMKLALRKI